MNKNGNSQMGNMSFNQLYQDNDNSIAIVKENGEQLNVERNVIAFNFESLEVITLQRCINLCKSKM